MSPNGGPERARVRARNYGSWSSAIREFGHGQRHGHVHGTEFRDNRARTDVKLYLMRHGPAEDEADSGVDADRALTASGRERVANVAKALLDAKESPSEILTSPLVRAVQTAEIVAIVAGVAQLRIGREVAPGGDGARLARFLASSGRKRVMLVGHEPDMSGLLSTLLGTSHNRPFEKAMVIGLHLSRSAGLAKIRFVLEPRTLRFEVSGQEQG